MIRCFAELKFQNPSFSFYYHVLSIILTWCLICVIMLVRILDSPGNRGLLVSNSDKIHPTLHISTTLQAEVSKST